METLARAAARRRGQASQALGRGSEDPARRGAYGPDEYLTVNDRRHSAGNGAALRVRTIKQSPVARTIRRALKVSSCPPARTV
jgi:hypothetical protein